jgi:hypothetical protein
MERAKSVVSSTTKACRRHDDKRCQKGIAPYSSTFTALSASASALAKLTPLLKIALWIGAQGNRGAPQASPSCFLRDPCSLRRVLSRLTCPLWPCHL